MPNKKILVMYSGEGSNAWNLINKIAEDSFPADICGVIKGNYKGRENDLLERILLCDPDIICLAGYMHILPSKLLYQITPHILNIHPSYLPHYKGLNTHARVLADNKDFTGCTVHIVDREVDSGRIIKQVAVSVSKLDTVGSLSRRVLKAEHTLYPRALRRFLKELNNE